MIVYNPKYYHLIESARVQIADLILKSDSKRLQKLKDLLIKNPKAYETFDLAVYGSFLNITYSGKEYSIGKSFIKGTDLETYMKIKWFLSLKII